MLVTVGLETLPDHILEMLRQFTDVKVQVEVGVTREEIVQFGNCCLKHIS